MDHGWGSFRTTEGDVAVGDEVLRIDRSPRKFLRGQLSRWRQESRWEQLKATARIALFVLLFLSSLAQLYGAVEASIVMVSLVSLGVVVSLVSFWAKRVRGIGIPLSAIEDVTLDTDDRKLTIVHDAGGRPSVLGSKDGRWFLTDDLFSIFATGETGTTLTLRTADDAREARTILRTRGIVDDLDASKVGAEATKTEYRFDARNGAVFCEKCGSQVSPNDRTCPACDHMLRVERPENADSREPAVEF